jgi:peptide-methionine (R)-S-oxide reductase
MRLRLAADPALRTEGRQHIVITVGALSGCVPAYRGGMSYQVEKSDEQWREELSREEYAVLRTASTERPFVGEYTDTETTGIYRCKACQAKLFETDTKFHSGCGWPSFYQPLTDTVEYIEDTSHGMKRVEVRCANCGSHIGHVFPDGHGTPTGDRYCINSISLTLEPADQPAETSGS